MVVAFWSEEYKFKNTDIVVVNAYDINDIGVVIDRRKEENEETERLTCYYLVDLGNQGNHWFEDYELKLL